MVQSPRLCVQRICQARSTFSCLNRANASRKGLTEPCTSLINPIFTDILLIVPLAIPSLLLYRITTALKSNSAKIDNFRRHQDYSRMCSRKVLKMSLFLTLQAGAYYLFNEISSCNQTMHEIIHQMRACLNDDRRYSLYFS